MPDPRTPAGASVQIAADSKRIIVCYLVFGRVQDGAMVSAPADPGPPTDTPGAAARTVYQAGGTWSRYAPGGDHTQ